MTLFAPLQRDGGERGAGWVAEPTHILLDREELKLAWTGVFRQVDPQDDQGAAARSHRKGLAPSIGLRRR